jgi:hypothetical protein
MRQTRIDSRRDVNRKETAMVRTGIASAAVVALFALAGCSGAPAGGADMVSQPAPQVLPPAAPMDRLVAAIEAQDCVLTRQNVETILLDANLTQAQLSELTPQLAAEGRAEVAAEGTIRVLTDNCI